MRIRYFLRKLFGYDGYQMIRSRNWSFLGLTGAALGVVADLAQVLGSFALYGFWVALAVATLSGIAISWRMKFYHHLVVPFFASLWMIFIFCGFTVAQTNTQGGDNKGLIFSLLLKIDKTTQETKVVVDRTEHKVNQIVEYTKSVPECEDRDVYLQVMAAARRLPEPYSEWTLRGSTGKIIEIERGLCSMELLFVTGRSDGLMTEVNITYNTDDEISIKDVNAIKIPTENKTKVLLGEGAKSTVHGIVKPEEQEWYYIDVVPGKQVNLEVGPDFRPVAATVIDVGDMRQKFSFIAAKTRYEFLVAQLFRSTSDEEFWFRVEIK
jgi:hypothetical protein